MKLSLDFCQEFLNHCNSFKCHYDVSQCLVKQEVDKYNKRQQHEAYKFFFCPKCLGFHLGYQIITITDKNNKNKEIEIPIVKGGIIPVYGTRKANKSYIFNYACDCVCGDAMSKLAVYSFSNDDKNMCFYKRIQIHLERKSEWLNKQKGGSHDYKTLGG